MHTNDLGQLSYLLSTASSFSKPASELSVGMHTIYFKVQDENSAAEWMLGYYMKIIQHRVAPVRRIVNIGAFDDASLSLSS
jgi:hypothetical protein